MINPYRRGQDRIPGPGLQANEKKKLWIFGILFVLVLAAFFGTKIWEQTQDKSAGREEERPGSVSIDRAPSRSEQGAPLTEYRPRNLDEVRDDSEDMLLTGLSDLRESGGLIDDDTGDTRAVLDYLLDKAFYDNEVTRVSEPYYRKLPEEKALYDPGPYRGRFTSAFGEILELPDPIPYSGEVSSVKALHPILFRTGDGVLYRALAVNQVEKKPGDWIQVYGLFYRILRVKIDGEEEPALCLILTKKIKNAYPPVTVTEIDPKWADAVRELDYDQARAFERPFWLLLNYVRNLGEKGYADLKAGPDFAIEDMRDSAKPLARAPESYRFHFVAVEGRVVDPYRDYLQEDNPGKIPMVATATLVQPSAYLVRLASEKPWADYGFTVGEDFVRIEGIFYKRWQYEPRQGGGALEIPLIVVTDVIPIIKPESGTLKVLQWIMIGVAILIVLTFLFFALRDAKGRQAFRERVLEKKRRREARRSSAGEDE